MWLREGLVSAKDAFVRAVKGVAIGAVVGTGVIVAMNTQFTKQEGNSIQITPNQGAITLDAVLTAAAGSAAAGGAAGLLAGKKKYAATPAA